MYVEGTETESMFSLLATRMLMMMLNGWKMRCTNGT